MKKLNNKKSKIDLLKEDIRNSEKFHKLNYNGRVKEIYEILDDKIETVQGNVEKFYISFPGSIKDIHELIIN